MALLRSKPGAAESRTLSSPASLCSEHRTSRQRLLTRHMFGSDFRPQHENSGFWWFLPPAPSLTQAPPTLPLPGDSRAQPESGRPASLAPLSPSAPSRDVKPQTLSHKGQGLECNCWVSILGKTLHLQSLNFWGWEPVGM